MKYFVIEGKFKTFEYSLYDEAHAEIARAFTDFIERGMEEGYFLAFGDKAHGVIGIGKAKTLDGMLARFESDPLTLDDVVEYRIVEIENAMIGDRAEKFFK